MRWLGRRSVREFLRAHWHKEALLVVGAMPDLRPVVSRDELFDLAARDDVESRLVSHARGRYTLREGPFTRRMLSRMPARDWTLLVQGVNLHVDAADALLRRFAFIPYARLDDLMVSYAAPGGGVGPHVDSYDVFLLQATGHRRWMYGRQQDLRLRDDAPVKLLATFAPQREATLGLGDMLYLPPDYAHDGVAVDACTTYSIGFRAPSNEELAQAFLDHLRDTVALEGRYADPGLHPTQHPGCIGPSMQRQIARTLASIRWDANEVARFLGRYLTEPKQNVVFTPPRKLARARFAQRIARGGVRLDRRTHLLYDAARCYVNGEHLPLPAEGGEALRMLADARRLPAAACRSLPPDVLDILHDWHRHGFLAER